MTPLLAWLACAAPTPEPLPTRQWVWTEGDVRALAELRRDRPDAVGTVLIGELSFEGDAVVVALRQPPTLVGAPRGVVVRLDDSVSRAFEGRDDAGVAALIDAPLGRLLRQAERSAGPPDEVQLDFDCPVRLLPRWGEVLARLDAGALGGRPPWVTSLVAHVRAPAFRTALEGRVAGHVLQVFDTGDAPLDAASVGQAAVAAGLPYRLGIGTFERGRGGRAVTAHRAWLDHVDEACVRPTCVGVDLFPGLSSRP